MHISGLAEEKFDIRANFGMNSANSLLLFLRTQETRRLECIAVGIRQLVKNTVLLERSL